MSIFKRLYITSPLHCTNILSTFELNQPTIDYITKCSTIQYMCSVYVYKVHSPSKPFWKNNTEQQKHRKIYIAMNIVHILKNSS